MTTLFDRFWASGIRKMDKKRNARRAFDRVMKGQKDPEGFVDMLIFDIQARLKGNQLGFDKMYPATYLNGERWEDELPHSQDALGRLTDTSWADGMREQGLLN